MYTASKRAVPPPGPQLGDAGLKLVLIVGVVLGNVGRHVEAHDEGQICLGPDYLLQKLDRGALLKLEALADRSAGIDHDADPQGQIGLLGEIENLRGSLLIIQQGKVSLLQIVE